MTPVISPRLFYWMSVVDELKIFSCIAIIVVLVTVVVYLLWCSIEMETVQRNVVKRLIVAVIISAIICVFVPSSKTITKMIVAKNVTYERIGGAVDTVQSVYEDIMALFGEDADG